MFVDNGFFYTIDPASPAGDLITMAGGVDVAADAEPGKPYPLAKLRAAKPQAYLAVAGRGTTLSGLRTSGATKHLPAVRSGRFLLIDANALTDTGPRVVATLRQIAQRSTHRRRSARWRTPRSSWTHTAPSSSSTTRSCGCASRCGATSASTCAPADAERAFRAEMAFYSEHCQVGADAESLAGLRAECAADHPRPSSGSRPTSGAAARMLTDAIAFRAFPDVASLLAGLRARRRAGRGRLELGLLASRRRSPASGSSSTSS